MSHCRGFFLCIFFATSSPAVPTAEHSGFFFSKLKAVSWQESCFFQAQSVFSFFLWTFHQNNLQQEKTNLPLTASSNLWPQNVLKPRLWFRFRWVNKLCHPIRQFGFPTCSQSPTCYHSATMKPFPFKLNTRYSYDLFKHKVFFSPLLSLIGCALHLKAANKQALDTKRQQPSLWCKWGTSKWPVLIISDQ